jgi:hypothetical protein
VEVGGPEVLGLVEFVREGLDARDDKREVVTDPDALFFGAALAEKALLPGEGARLSDRRFGDWIAGQGGGTSERTAKPIGAAAQ